MSHFIRIDNRLIHGQIIATWTPHLKVRRFVIANDLLTQNELRMRMLRMVVPQEIALDMLGIEAAGKWLSAHQNDGQSVMVLLENCADAIQLYKSYHFTQLNLGNIHHVNGSTKFTQAVYLTDDDCRKLRQLAHRDVQIEIRTLPTDTPMALNGVC